MADPPPVSQPSEGADNDEELEFEGDIDVDMGCTNSLDNSGSGPAQPASSSTVGGAAPALPEIDPVGPAPVPTKKDASLREFLSKMDDYAPIVRWDSPSPQPLIRFFQPRYWISRILISWLPLFRSPTQ